MADNRKLTAEEHINKGHKKGLCWNCMKGQWFERHENKQGFKRYVCTICGWFCIGE